MTGRTSRGLKGMGEAVGGELACVQPASGTASAKALRVPPVRVQQSGAAVEKAPGRGELEAKEKKVKILEHQRREVRTRPGGRHCQEPGGSGRQGHVAGTVWGDWGRAVEPLGSTAGAGISIQLVPKVFSPLEAAGEPPWLAWDRDWAPIQPSFSPRSCWR